MRFGLIGRDISRSQSPELFKRYNPGTDSTYELIDADDFRTALEFVRENGFKAVNVTAPFKDDAFFCASRHDRISLLTQTSNLLVFSGEKIESFNTDYFGVRETLVPLIGNGKKIKRALVLGCGGAAKAAALATMDLNLDTFIANRNVEKAEALAVRYSSSRDNTDTSSRIEVVDFGFIVQGEYDILISALSETPEHVKNKIAGIRNKIILEAEYRHPILSDITGNQYISGTEWLKNQAIPAYRIFFADF